jgi:hypothetical protein
LFQSFFIGFVKLFVKGYKFGFNVLGLDSLQKCFFFFAIGKQEANKNKYAKFFHECDPSKV